MKKYAHEVCIISFDQPLYAKAREIVAAAPLIMSYRLVTFMQGSGFKEALSIDLCT